MFDELEARLNRLAMERLANAVAVINGEEVPVIFDAEYQAGTVGVGMGAAAPQMYIANTRVPAAFIGSRITVNGARWSVGDCQADSSLATGLSLALLEKA
ncbi:hypothetical protein [Massilia sp.]|uniref:head-tail joining protein n=1 Tax=Massilia sp. TaxID=1882437 RepID=UPI0028A7299E|nr:hypothetical protein [Massilia sp.]